MRENAVVAFMYSFLSLIPLLTLKPKEMRGTQYIWLTSGPEKALKR